jgi:hypothetical protein
MDQCSSAQAERQGDERDPPADRRKPVERIANLPAVRLLRSNAGKLLDVLPRVQSGDLKKSIFLHGTTGEHRWLPDSEAAMLTLDAAAILAIAAFITATSTLIWSIRRKP